jgi:hypothetical protein
MTKPRDRPATYRCLACGHEWVGTVGPQTFGSGSHAPACPLCPSLYAKWLNFPGGYPERNGLNGR